MGGDFLKKFGSILSGHGVLSERRKAEEEYVNGRKIFIEREQNFSLQVKWVVGNAARLDAQFSLGKGRIDFTFEVS